MTHRLDIGTGETYSVSKGSIEEHTGASVDGTLDIDGTLRLIDNPEPQPFSVSEDFDIPLGLDLPLSTLSLRTMNIGLSIFLIGTVSILLGASALFRNYWAGAIAVLSILLLLMSGLFGIGLEAFWAVVGIAVILLAAGLVVRGATA